MNRADGSSLWPPLEIYEVVARGDDAVLEDDEGDGGSYHIGLSMDGRGLGVTP
jgi:hypothetical protein